LRNAAADNFLSRLASATPGDGHPRLATAATNGRKEGGAEIERGHRTADLEFRPSTESLGTGPLAELSSVFYVKLISALVGVTTGR
jgi:hypothetical protein